MPSRRSTSRTAVVRTALTLMVVLALACSSCTTSGEEGGAPAQSSGEVRRGGTLTYATNLKFTGFNPVSPTAATLALANVMMQVWPGAFRLQPDGPLALNRDLLESAEQTAATPQTVVYRLNPKAVWSDGDPLDGRDFEYFWRTAYTRGARDVDGSEIATNTGAVFGVIERVTLSDADRTVTVVFARPYPDWRSLFPFLVPSHVAERVGWNRGFTNFDPDVVVSAGAYRLSGYRPDQDLTLVRNERYWGTPANLDSIVVRILPESGQVLAALKNREIDLADLVSPSIDDVVQARAVPGLTTVVYEQARYDRLLLNFGNELLAVPEVRRAIALSVDRPGILARLNGQLDPARAKLTNNRIYVPAEPEYQDTSGGRYDRADPPAARRLLESADFRRGADGVYARGGVRLSVRMAARAGVDELIQAQLRETGIEVRIEQTANLIDTLRKGDFDLGVLSRPTAPGAKAGETVQFTTAGGFNYGKYSNPQVDDLVRQANSELDEARRVALYHQIDRILWDEMVTVPLQQAIGVLVHRDTYLNVVPFSGGGIFANAATWGLRPGR